MQNKRGSYGTRNIPVSPWGTVEGQSSRAKPSYVCEEFTSVADDIVLNDMVNTSNPCCPSVRSADERERIGRVCASSRGIVAVTSDDNIVEDSGQVCKHDTSRVRGKGNVRMEPFQGIARAHILQKSVVDRVIQALAG